MNRLVALVRREYWENRIAFVATPLAIAALHLVGVVMAILTTVYFDNDLYTFHGTGACGGRSVTGTCASS